MFPLQSHPSLPLWAPNLGVAKDKRKRGESLTILGQRSYWRDWKGGKQGADLELRGSLLGKVLSDSDRQRPGLGMKPNPKSRLQAFILVSKLAPEKGLDTHLLWTRQYPFSRQYPAPTLPLLTKP